MRPYFHTAFATLLGVCLLACGDHSDVAQAVETTPSAQQAKASSAKKPTEARAESAKPSSQVPSKGGVLPGYRGIYENGRALTRAEVAVWEPAEMRRKRNEVYARYGRAFQAADLQKHYESTGWYSVDAGYSDAVLTPTDRANVELVASFETTPRTWSGQVGELMFISDNELAIVDGDSIYAEPGGERWYVARGSKYVITWSGSPSFGSSTEALELWTYTGDAWRREALQQPQG